MKAIIIAIDGYSSCGKSTLAKALAKQLNYSYMDTGAMYRSLSLYFMRMGLNVFEMSEEEINSAIDEVHISFNFNPQLQKTETYLNEELVEQEIRGKEVSEIVSEFSQVKTVRKRMIDLQRIAGKSKSLVIDGRDIGSVVFPEAELKIFMTAEPAIRAKRRFEELKVNGTAIELEEVESNLAKRDYNDTHRKENPLIKAEDARVLDNSNLNQKEQLSLVLQWLKELNVLN